jgi:DNA gyrase/topoisomerase IV subunit B
MEGFVATIVNARLAEFLEENPAEANQVIRKAVQAAQARGRRPQGARPHAAQERARRTRACRASSPTAR